MNVKQVLIFPISLMFYINPKHINNPVMKYKEIKSLEKKLSDTINGFLKEHKLQVNTKVEKTIKKTSKQILKRAGKIKDAQPVKKKSIDPKAAIKYREIKKTVKAKKK